MSQKFIHTVVIISEHNNYNDLTTLAKDANEGDAILRSWSKKTITEDALTDPEREFFFSPDWLSHA